MTTSTCTQCENLGYRTFNGKRWAQATVCTCQNPCPACEGDGAIIQWGDDGKTWVKACKCVGVNRRVQRYNDAHLPARYHGKTVEDFVVEATGHQSVKKWLLDFQKRGQTNDPGFLLFGGPGVGKTHLLCGILRFLVMERGLQCRYIDCFQLLAELKATFETGTGSSALMEDVCNVSILGIDELGKTRPTGWQHGVLDQIISRRYDAGLTTFVTTNYVVNASQDAAKAPNPNDPNWLNKTAGTSLQDRVGPRIYSRLREMCRPFHLQGTDKRQTSLAAQ